MKLTFGAYEIDKQQSVLLSGHDQGLTMVWGTLTRLPGSPTIWVSHHLQVPEEYRGKGYSTQYDAYMRSVAFGTYHASAILASVKRDNAIQQARLTKLGWERISNAMWITRKGEQ